MITRGANRAPRARILLSHSRVLFLERKALAVFISCTKFNAQRNCVNLSMDKIYLLLLTKRQGPTLFFGNCYFITFPFIYLFFFFFLNCFLLFRKRVATTYLTSCDTLLLYIYIKV